MNGCDNKLSLQTHTKPQVSFVLNKNSHICLVGNGLAERMQHDGWLEAYLQSTYKDKQLVFRNLGFSGDQIKNTQGLPINIAMGGDYFTRCQADVLFVFYGLNESFNPTHKDDFKNDLSAYIKDKKTKKYNGKSSPSLILFSPIAHENLKLSYMPSGEERNKKLRLITSLMKEVAQEENIPFVDLFSPSLELYKKSSTPLTINGIHLTKEGNRQIAAVICQTLFGIEINQDKNDLKELRKVIVNKNYHWFNRYRTTDSNDIWGSRHTKEDNYKVLRRELEILDVMTANRDKEVWAVANGQSYNVDDSNTPEYVTVNTNFPGKGPDGQHTFLNEEESIKRIKVGKGMEVNQFASEKEFPELVNPVQMSVDTKGRLWVAAWHSYPKWNPTEEMKDKLIILPDEDRDGKADKCIVFAHVHNPTGFEFWNGGVLVVSAPDIIFFKDTDGDDVADVQIKMLHGIDSADTHHTANNLKYGPDGGFYYQRGVFHRHMVETPYGPNISTAGGMYRFDPVNSSFNFHMKSLGPNPHGTCFSRWGYHYANDGTGGKPFQVVLDESQKRFIAHLLTPQRIRPVASCNLISGEHFPPEMRENFVKCNVIGFLGLKQYKLKMVDGVSEGIEVEDFLVSTDPNFRPTDMRIGSDGAAYISDWQNPIIGHLQHNIRDPSRDHKHGRIYRVTYKGRPLQKAVKIDGARISELLNNLTHPANDVRYRSRIELSEHDRDEVVKATKKWLTQFDPKKESDIHPIVEAMWLLQRNQALHQDLLNLVLNSSNEHARRAAKTIQHLNSSDYGKYPPARVRKKNNKKKPKAKLTGESIYNRKDHCATCHQKKGEGIPLIYPPLAGSEWTTGDPDTLIKLSLHGLFGPIIVKGVKYEGATVPPMPPFKNLLNDKELALVLTYVRNSWGNKASTITPDMVAKVREETKNQKIFYKPEELIQANKKDKPYVLTYEGEKGPGKGKHIVFLANDHEYRSEESCPALAKILAKRYGFKCTVLFGIDPKTKNILPGSSFMPGMENLKTADLMFCFIRFLKLSDEDMKNFDDYLKRGGPVIGLRTSTHGFSIKSGKYIKYSYNNKDENYHLGFGRQILGESWAGHYGKNHTSSTRIDLVEKQSHHPINLGVKNAHAMSGGYFAKPMPDSIILAMAQPLTTMKADSAADPTKKPVPTSWIRTYKGEKNKEGRVFCSTHGASEDILNEGYRRQLINAVFWTMNLESHIKADMDVNFVGPYKPITFKNRGHNKSIKPRDIADWDSTIWPAEKK